MYPRRLRPPPDPQPPRAPRGGGSLAGVLRRLKGLAFAAALSLGAAIVLGMLPDRYNLLAPFDPDDPATPLTGWKLSRALPTPEACLALAATLPELALTALPDRRENDACGIEGHVLLRGLSEASLTPVSTSCETAVRLYLWERHTLQPAAEAAFGIGVARVAHLSSYSCRRIRTEEGTGPGMSAHATAAAIDITGVRLAGGRNLRIAEGWDTEDPQVRRFWRMARDGACDWFGTVLSPEHDALHADHFHLGQDRGRACR